MHAFSLVTLGIFVAGYSTARWDLVTRLYELSIFAWDHGVLIRAAKGFALLSFFFVLLVLPVARIAASETDLVSLADDLYFEHEVDRRSILELPVVASLRVSSSSAEGPSSGVAGWDMVTQNGLIRVFWPSDAPRGSIPGVLVGFRNSDTDVFVVGILEGVEVRFVQSLLPRHLY
jgi:phosphatidylinositol glycan class Q protein